MRQSLSTGSGRDHDSSQVVGLQQPKFMTGLVGLGASIVTRWPALFLALGTAPLSAQAHDDYSHHVQLNRSASERLSVSNNVYSQSSVWEEIGYVFAMETVFTGMSFLGSRQNRWGAAITGGFDLFMAVAGLENASLKASGIQRTGHYAISTGFAAKSLYNFHFGREHSKKAQFLTNFIGYNVLVFAGYFLDTLK